MKLKSKTNGQVTIRHHQTIKQSHAYQSIDVSYGVEFSTDNTEKSIKAGFLRAEELVENALVAKFQEQQTLLKKLGEANR